VSEPPKQEETKTSTAWLDGIEAEGFRNLTVDDLIRLKGIGITPDYIQAIKATGIKGVDSDNLIRLKGIDIDAAWILQIQSLFPSTMPSGITPGYIKEAQKRFKNITIDDLIRLKGMGIL